MRTVNIPVIAKEIELIGILLDLRGRTVLEQEQKKQCVF